MELHRGRSMSSEIIALRTRETKSETGAMATVGQPHFMRSTFKPAEPSDHDYSDDAM